MNGKYSLYFLLLEKKIYFLCFSFHYYLLPFLSTVKLSFLLYFDIDWSYFYVLNKDIRHRHTKYHSAVIWLLNEIIGGSIEAFNLYLLSHKVINICRVVWLIHEKLNWPKLRYVSKVLSFIRPGNDQNFEWNEMVNKRSNCPRWYCVLLSQSLNAFL